MNPESPTSHDATAGLPGASGLGPTLRALREAQGLTLADASARLKFSVRLIDALELEKWDVLPTGLPLRGMVKNYGRFLETDIDALMIMLDSQLGHTGKAKVVAAAGALRPADTPLHGEPASRPWGWMLVILVILFVAGFYALERGWVPESWLVFDWMKSL